MDTNRRTKSWIYHKSQTGLWRNLYIIETAESVLPGNNKVLPVNFSKENKTMVSHLANLFNSHKVAIPEKYR